MNMLPASRRSILIGAKDPRAEEIRFIQESGFSKSQIDDIKEHLKRLESQKSSGSINKYELFDILKGFFVFPFINFYFCFLKNKY